MKIAGLLAGLLFLISFAAQADINNVSSFDFAREINISKVIEKAHAQDVNIIPAVSQSENKYGYDYSNEPDSIDDAARMLEYKIREMGILSTVIIHESEPPFIKATIGPLTGEQYKNMLDLFNHEDGDLYYYGYKVQLSVLA